MKFDIPKIVTISKIGTTLIISLGKVGQTEFAVQYELLKSNLQASEYYMLGKCFFARTSKTWNEIARFSYQELFIEDKPPLDEIPNTNKVPVVQKVTEKDLNLVVGIFFIKSKLQPTCGLDR